MADHSAETSSAFNISNGLYDFLKAVSLYVLPAAATLYAGLGEIWHYNNVVQVVATITAVDTFLGALLGILKKGYTSSDAPYDGKLLVDTSNPEKKTYGLEITTPLDTIDKQKSISLKVQPPA